MDLIDIMLARALTPQGQISTFAARTIKAEQDASAAVASAQTAIDNIESITERTNTNNAAAEEALGNAQAALEALQEAGQRIDLEDVDTEVNKMALGITGIATQNDYTQTLTATMPDGITAKTAAGIGKFYKDIGTNEDGGMTQKAIKLYVESVKSDIEEDIATAIGNIEFPEPTTTGGGTSNLNAENDGLIVVVGADGNITPGTVSEEELIESLIIGGGYTARDAVGLEVDYDNKSFKRTQQAAYKSMGNDFNSFLMYGGRRRCNVADDGTINAFYGENGYTEDGSNGQVMVYQPKFYYQRIPITTTDNKVGKIIVRDSFMVSTTAQNGFKVHPIFKTASGDELDYVLFSAYEGTLYDNSASAYVNSTSVTVDFDNDKLSSVSGAKPITGTNGLSLQKAEQLATNRGTGWHIFTMAAESANQMLEIIEFGSLNGQSSLGKGVSDLTIQGNYNQAAITGATASLGNASGAAESTTIETNGTQTTETEDGKTSISYRGIENPWGNVWQMIGGVTVFGNTTSNGGVPHICNDFNYSYSSVSNNYSSVGFSLPNGNGWVSALGYGNKNFDWVLMPADCATGANSALPIGDNGWFDANLTGLRMVVQGGGWSFAESDGPFYYGCDRLPTDSTYKSYGARLLFIPTKNEIYTANIAKWQQEMNIGG